MERCHYSGQREVFEILAKRRFGLPERRVHGGGDPEFFELRDGLCREDRFGVAGGVQSACRDAEGGTSVDINYRWKTFQRDRFDVDDIERVREAAARGGRVLVVQEGGGPHHFAKFSSFRFFRDAANQTLFTSVATNWTWPADWLEDYVNETRSLMRMHAELQQAWPNVCVLWKLLHLGPRAAESASGRAHHPSVVMGAHHALNNITADLAREAGIDVIDMSDLTRKVAARVKLEGAHPTLLQEEGDPYHGYDHDWLAPILAERVCAACERRRKLPRTHSQLDLHSTLAKQGDRYHAHARGGSEGGDTILSFDDAVALVARSSKLEGSVLPQQKARPRPQTAPQEPKNASSSVSYVSRRDDSSCPSDSTFRIHWGTLRLNCMRNLWRGVVVAQTQVVC